MSILKHPLFLALSALTISNEIIERAGWSIPFINSYLDDLACLPVVLTLALAFLRTFFTSPGYTLSKMQIVIAVIYISVAFEWILPSVSSRYTRDHIDILMYVLGAISFGRFINRKDLIKAEAAS